MLTATLAYAVVAALFLKTFLFADIDVDTTLYQEALSMIGRLFGFFLGLFSLLFLFGVIQLAYMIKLQNKAREQAYNVYRSLGMTEREIKRTALCEYRSIIAWSIIAVVFLAIVIFGLFS
jgi:predicted lysophospholipase L1 biosynthesis ABC-type transport system permease subunit